MGYNTALMILNDQLENIKDDPNFGRRIFDAIIEKTAEPNSKNFDSRYDLLQSQHADEDQLVVVGGNMIQKFSDLSEKDAIFLLKAGARSLGLEIALRKFQ